MWADNVGALPADPNTPRSSWCLGQLGDGVTKGLKNIQLLRLIQALWTVTSGPKTEALSKPTNRSGVQADGSVGDQTWWLPQAPRRLLWRRVGLTTV